LELGQSLKDWRRERNCKLTFSRQASVVQRTQAYWIYIRKVEKKSGQLYNVEFQTFENVKDFGKIKK
jgi:hypothetical protein